MGVRRSVLVGFKIIKLFAGAACIATRYALDVPGFEPR
jgi:hypothetical protein